MTKKEKIFRGEKGQSLVEFALLLPVLMLILLGIVEFGFMLNAKIVITSAAREGARVLALKGEDSPLVDQAVNDTIDFDYLEITNLNIIKDAPGNLEDLDDETAIPMAVITVSGDVAFITDFFDFLFPAGSINMGSKAEMRVEYAILPGGG